MDGLLAQDFQDTKRQTLKVGHFLAAHLSAVPASLEGVIGDPNPNVEQDMGDASKKELTDQEMENFDEKRSQAMQTYSEVCKRYLRI